MKSRRIIQLVVLLAATAFLHSHLAQAQVRSGGTVPAGSPPANLPRPGMQPMGVPPVGTPPTVVPPAGVPQAGLPPAGASPVLLPQAGTPVPGGLGTAPDLGIPPTLNTPNNAVSRTMTNGSLSRPFGTNGFGRRGGRRDGDGDADDMRWRRPYGSYRRDNRNGTNGVPGAGARGFDSGTNGLTAPQGVLSAPR